MPMPIRRFKVLVVGSNESSKSALIDRVVSGNCNPVDPALDPAHSFFEITEDNEQCRIIFEVTEKCNLEVRVEELEHSDAVLFVCDVTNDRTLSNFYRCNKLLMSAPHKNVMLVGIHPHNPLRQIYSKLNEGYAHLFGIEYAKINLSLEGRERALGLFKRLADHPE